MHSIKLENGQICKDRRRILEEQHKFYKTLYTEDRKIQFNIKNETDIRLSEEDKNRLDENVSLEELGAALKMLKLNKSPGNDGLTVEFYKTFWADIKVIIWPMYTQVMSQKLLGASGRRGLINLIPKKGKDSRIIKNLRPLTLLNIDYKILAMALAHRLKSVLPSLIGEQQTGFMQGRDIQLNIRKTIDIITYANQNKTVKALIINIDFIKCFDLVAHNSIFDHSNLFPKFLCLYSKQWLYFQFVPQD